MDRDEKVALKAACIKAAAELLSGLPQSAGVFRGQQFAAPPQGGADTGSCARYARDLFGKLTNEPWE